MNTYSFAITFALVAAASAGLVPVTVVNPGVGAPVLASFYGANGLVTRLIVPAGSGLEGQYIPDNTEKLYDDGSYRPEARATPLSASPAGLVPTGSGLEGQYVPDNSERSYDDGSYRPQANAVPLSVSPYGFVPSGSGLEGQYVHDLTERLYDDGSYKPALYP